MPNNPLDYMIQSPDAQRYALLQEASYKDGGRAGKAEDLFALKPEPKAPPDESFAQLSGLIADIGKNRAEYERIAQGGAFDSRQFTPENLYAMRLLQAARATPDPERYLETLSPYHRAQLQFELDPYSRELGAVYLDEPNKAAIKRLDQVANTIPHELTHTLQLRKAHGIDFEDDAGALIRARGLTPEMRKSVFPSANVDNMKEVWANVNARAHEVNAAGGDFINSPEGRAMFPTPALQREYYTRALPGVNSLTPDTGSFVPNNEPYAAKALRVLGMAEGGAVSLDQMRHELLLKAPKRDEVEEFNRFEAAGAPAYAKPLDMAGRATFLPFKDNLPDSVMNTREWAVPGILAEIYNAFTAPARSVTQLGFEAPEEALNTAFNVMGGGLGLSHAAPAPAGSLGMAVKSKGGNWVPESVEKSLQPLNRGPEHRDDALMMGLPQAQVDTPQLQSIYQSNAAVNNWTNSKLVKYVKNEMGTPEDPLRKLAEDRTLKNGEIVPGALHVPSDSLVTPGVDIIGDHRLREGFPPEGFGKSQLARQWENASDLSINPIKIENLNKARREPWMDKLPAESTIYGAKYPSALNVDLGFNHLIDELQNATSSTSTLPNQLRIDPAKLERMTVPEVSQHVSKINDWRAAEAVKAEKKGMMENLSAAPRFDVPEPTQLSFVKEPGMKWIDVPETTDPKGLKLCTTLGTQGGWCTMGENIARHYGSGENRLTTLVDADGRPHAQAKITQVPAKGQNTPEPPNITELKPPGNSFGSERSDTYAKRDPEYKAKVTDSVLKFLNAGEWGEVRDLNLYGILDTHDQATLSQAVLTRDYSRSVSIADASAAHRASAKRIKAEAPRFITREQLGDFLTPAPGGHANGGSVKKPFTSPKHSGYNNIDQMRYELLRQG